MDPGRVGMDVEGVDKLPKQGQEQPAQLHAEVQEVQVEVEEGPPVTVARDEGEQEVETEVEGVDPLPCSC